MKHIIFKITIVFWQLIPFKKFFSRIIKSNKYLLSKFYQDLKFKGIIDVQIEAQNLKLYNPGFTTIENEIFWFGLENGWEKISMKIWKTLAKESNTILDIGANSGVYSFVASIINSNSNIYSFEPVKRTSDIFKENLKLNKNSKINLIEKAVSNKNGIATFYDLPTESQYSASLNENMLKDYGNRISYDVDVVALDSLEELANQKIDLIKIDVEMHEPEAIEGMINLIKHNEPSILIEVLTDEIAEKIEAQLSDLNYLYFTIDEINLPKQVKNIRKSDFHNFLLIKKEKINPSLSTLLNTSI